MNKMIELPEPDRIDTSAGFVGTVWADVEIERVVLSIVSIAQRGEKGWRPISWEEYKVLCGRKVQPNEHDIFRQLLSDGFLEKDQGMYSITPRFIQVLELYLIP